jgi:hypothetical protein
LIAREAVRPPLIFSRRPPLYINSISNEINDGLTAIRALRDSRQAAAAWRAGRCSQTALTVLIASS